MIKKIDLIATITSPDSVIRDGALEDACRGASVEQLLHQCRQLEQFRRGAENLYERVRAVFFLYAIYRFHLPQALADNDTSIPTHSKMKSGHGDAIHIPFSCYTRLLSRRFEEAIEILNSHIAEGVMSPAIASAYAECYHALAFQTLADQVRRSVRSAKGNQWMFRVGHPLDHPLRLRGELLANAEHGDVVYPVLRESTPVRMDLTHSAWSDIFFLGMDFPDGARVLNISIDLGIQANAVDDGGAEPKPPIETYLRVIDKPVLRLASVDLDARAEISAISEVFDFAKDYLGLLKAAVIASGLLPPGMEGATQSLRDVLERVVGPGLGLEIVSCVNNIPKGSRLAVSTNLLASLIALCMRATGQTRSLTGPLLENERRVVAARAILGEWLGGSGGGWQDSGGVWPGMKLIEGVEAAEGDPEWGVSRGRLLPQHTVLEEDQVSSETRRKLEASLVLVHGGMAQDVGPILEMVTEKYLLRSKREWVGRREAIRGFDEICDCLRSGDIRALGNATQKNFEGPIQTIVPWATNQFTELLIERISEEFGDDFWGFWMLGGMAGGGMGFIFAPHRKPEGKRRLKEIMSSAKRQLESGVPFAMAPVVYDFQINERGTFADLFSDKAALMPASYYCMTIPELLKRDRHELSRAQQTELARVGAASRSRPELAGMTDSLINRLLPGDPGRDEQTPLHSLLHEHGFDPEQHEQIRVDMKSGRIGLAQNRLSVSSRIEDVAPGDVAWAGDAGDDADPDALHRGQEALRNGEVAVVTLAGGVGSRWTHGAGVVKALNPFAKLGGKHRNFIEVHLAKSLKTSQTCGETLPHVITTSYLTYEPLKAFSTRDGGQLPFVLSAGTAVGLRMIPATRDLRFAWQETPQKLLDVQAQKVQESLRAALIQWAQETGECADYTDNVPSQCLHPVGHWYEVPNMLRNGTLRQLLRDRPQLQTLMLHNVDTLGANVDAGILGQHLVSDAAMTVEVIPRQLEDRGGGLARVNGRLRLIEGLALPREDVEFNLSYYNSATMWLDIDRLLEAFGLGRADLADDAKVNDAVRAMASRMPTYITLKDVKRRWGNGQEDIFPVAQFEKLWGDMTAIGDLECRYVVVDRRRGQQLKDVSQLDGWLRDGSAAYVQSLCAWQPRQRD